MEAGLLALWPGLPGDGHLASQSAWLVNYAERHRAGLWVGTAITKGTANFLVNRRMSRSQQMRWSRRGYVSARAIASGRGELTQV